MEIIPQDYQMYVENCKASSNIVLTEKEFQVADISHRGFLDKEVADILRKSVQTVSFQLKQVKKRLGIDKNVELTWYMYFVALRKNFDINEIRKHGVAVFFSIYLFVLAITPDFQMEMRMLRMRSSAQTSTRAIIPERDSDLMFAA